MTVSFGEVEFIDVSESDWFSDYVLILVNNDVTSGYGDHTFRPNTIISVEEFVTLTLKSIGEKESDIPKINWSDGFMDKARSLAIVNEGDFVDLSRPITRGEMARIVLRASLIEPPINFMDYASKIVDLNEMAPYWQNIAIRIYSTGIITGYVDGTFGLYNNATRAEASVVLSKLILPQLRNMPEISDFDIRKHEINQTWQIYQPRHFGEIYSLLPSVVSPYHAGTLHETVINDGLNMLKFLRNLAYLSDDIYVSDLANDLSQHGALLLATSEFSHTPEQPSDMDTVIYDKGYDATSSGNLAAGISTLDKAIQRLMDDEDVNNIEKIGHRRWQLLPSLKEVGMGFVTANTNYKFYAVIKVFRNLETENRPYDMVNWPSKTAFPIEFFGPDIPWSTTLNPTIYNASKISEISVTVNEVGSGLVWVMDKNDTDLNGEYFNVETTGYGIPFCIIYRPDPETLTQYNLNQIYEVTINNVYLLTGSKVSLTFRTRFFNLDK